MTNENQVPEPEAEKSEDEAPAESPEEGAADEEEDEKPAETPA